MAQTPEKQTKKSNREELEITPEIQEYWSERDIDPTSEFYTRAAKEARRRHYAKQILGSLDPDKTAKLNDMLSGDVKSRNKIADKFAKENPDFYVPTEKFVDILGSEDAVNDYLQLAKEYEESRGISTEGQGPEAYGFGSRAAATVFGSYKATRDDPSGRRSYNIEYDPEEGYINQMVSIEMDPRSKDFKHMSEVLKEDKPELADGIDTIHRSKTDMLQGAKLAPVGSVMPDKLPTVDSNVGNATGKSPMDGSAVSGGLSLAGDLVDVLDQKSDGTKSVGGAALKGAAAGAAAGTAFGPIGTAVGGVVGGAVGAIGTALGNKKIVKANEELTYKQQQARSLSNFQPAQNTQSQIYETGTYAANMTKPVEVERDELVLRKNSLGKYSVAADFKGGKTHEQGGEDYILKEGDVVFPGKKRDKIMKLLKDDNNAGIESERMRLPKDLPNTGELENGYRNVPGVPKYPTSTRDIFGVEDTMTKEERARYIADTSAGSLPSWLVWDKDAVDSAVSNTNTPKPTRTADGPKSEVESASRETVEKIQGARLGEYTPPETPKNLPRVESSERDRLIQEKYSSKRAPNSDGRDFNVDEAMRYTPAASNILKGLFTKPETATRRFVTPETLRYRDTSQNLRRESELQKRIDMENASRFSGGSGQLARAGKASAGAAASARRQQIDTQESARALGIEAQNVGIRNQAKQTNLELSNRYDELDLANRAAIDAYFDQGVYDLGRIGSQIRRDKAMERSQDIALKMLERDRFKYNKGDSSIEFTGGK